MYYYLLKHFTIPDQLKQKTLKHASKLYKIESFFRSDFIAETCRLDFNSKYLIRYDLKYAASRGSRPLKLDTLSSRKLCRVLKYKLYIYGSSSFIDTERVLLYNNNARRDEIHIGNVGGDAIGIGVSGSGNIIGKDITVSQTAYSKLEPEFRTSIEDFLALINSYGGQLTEEQKRSLKESVEALAKGSEGLKSGEVVTDEIKVDEIKSKQIGLAEKIVQFLPQVAESIASVTPLAPFSKSIGKGTGYFADWIRRKLSEK